MMYEDLRECVSCQLKVIKKSNSKGSLFPHYFRIMYFVEGKGSVFIDENEYKIYSNLLLLITPYNSFRLDIDGNSIGKYIVFNIHVSILCNHLTIENDQHIMPITLDENEKKQIIGFYDYYVMSFLGNSGKKNAQLFDFIKYIKKIVTEHTSLIIYEQNIIKQIKKFIFSNIGEKLNLNQIAAAFNYSEKHLNRLFKKYTGSTIHSYILEEKIEFSKQLLVQGLSIHEICDCIGFDDPNYFGNVFKKRVGKTPKDYLKNIRSELL